MKTKTVCFFVKTVDPKVLDFVEFYRIDIEILESLGYTVKRATSWPQLLAAQCDFYFVWWFAYGAVPVALSRLLGRPVIVVGAVHTIQGGGLYDWHPLKRIAMKTSMALADRTLLISNTDAARLGEFKPASVSVVYCAINCQKYRTITKNSPREKVVLTVTHLTKGNVHRKMILEAIDAFAQFSKHFPAFVYKICGSPGDALDIVKARIRRYGLEQRILLVGRISDDEKVQLLNQAMVYLQPSRCEGFGLAIVEAQACGLPVVTTPDEGVREVNGDSVWYGEDVDDFALGLRTLATSDSDWSEFSRRGIINAERYCVAARKIRIAHILAELGVGSLCSTGGF